MLVVLLGDIERGFVGALLKVVAGVELILLRRRRRGSVTVHLMYWVAMLCMVLMMMTWLRVRGHYLWI